MRHLRGLGLGAVTVGRVWPRPSAIVRRWALVSVVLLFVAIGLAGLGIAVSSAASAAFDLALEQDSAQLEAASRDLERAGGAFDVLLTEALVVGGLAIVASVVGLVVAVRARKRARGTGEPL